MNKDKNIKRPIKTSVDISPKRITLWCVGFWLGFGIFILNEYVGGWWFYLWLTEIIMVREFDIYKEKLYIFPVTEYRKPKYLKKVFEHCYFFDEKLPKIVIQCIYAHVIIAVIGAGIMAITIILLRRDEAYCISIFWDEVIYYGGVQVLVMLLFGAKLKISELKTRH